jgi:hypothetical protein
MQLSMMVLVEESTERSNLFARRNIKTYLVLALDENGDYYQQKYVRDTDVYIKDGEPVYIKDPSGAPLKWIPAEIVVDEEWPAGSLPRRPGYLYPTCMMSLYRYRMSADYKESLRFYQPTLCSTGWPDNGAEIFEALNGRQYFAFGIGVENRLPDGVVPTMLGANGEFQPYENYFDASDKRARAVGAIINDPAQGADVTATKSVIDNKNSTAVMSMIVKNTEAALKRVILYCGMFEGLWGQDNIESNLDKIQLKLPREFVAVTMTAEEINSVIAALNNRLISLAEAQRKLVAGGFTIGKAEQILAELDTEAGDMRVAQNDQLL